MKIRHKLPRLKIEKLNQIINSIKTLSPLLLKKIKMVVIL